MKITLCWLALSVSFIFVARGDLTIVYSSTTEPTPKAGSVGAAEPARAGANMTIKLKGDRARIDATPQLTTIFDGKTGDVINLLNDEKTVVRISSDKLKAVTDMLDKFSDKKTAPEKPMLTPTGQKETVNGYETEQYAYDGPGFKAIYWIAPGYPDGAAILAQLQSIKSEFWDAANTKMPDFRDFPGLPIRTRISLSKETFADKLGASPSTHGTEITSTITSVDHGPINDSEFTIPGDFKETKLPDIFNKLHPAQSVSPSP
jgi:Domain of unknown function (DUF4412)